MLHLHEHFSEQYFNMPKGKVNSLIPGAAIVILEMTTCVIPLAAAFLDFPTGLLFSSNTTIPSIISLRQLVII